MSDSLIPALDRPCSPEAMNRALQLDAMTPLERLRRGCVVVWVYCLYRVPDSSFFLQEFSLMQEDDPDPRFWFPRTRKFLQFWQTSLTEAPLRQVKAGLVTQDYRIRELAGEDVALVQASEPYAKAIIEGHTLN